MFKFSILFCFISFSTFSQKTDRLEFSVSQIDSLSMQESCFKIFDFGGRIQSEKEYLNEKTKTVGSGYGGWKIQAFFNDSLYYNSLSKKEKRVYDDEKTCRLIRADYSSFLEFDDGSSEKEKVLFYFSNNEVFYIKYESDSISKNAHKESTYHNFFFSDIESELASNKALKEELVKKKNEIVKVWLER